MPRYSVLKLPVQLFESLAFNIPLAFTDRQSLLEAPSVLDKLILMITMLSRETNVLSLERRIHSQVHSQIEESQREYYIREQIKALQNELGENEDGSDVNEIDEYTHRIDSLILSEEVRDKLMGRGQEAFQDGYDVTGGCCAEKLSRHSACIAVECCHKG